MSAGCYARRKTDPRHDVSDIIIESLEGKVKYSQRLGMGLFIAMTLVWLGTMMLVRVWPDMLGLMPIAACQ